jgi:3',5'-cyclic AMP phosphodiesterase CpdA
VQKGRAISGLALLCLLTGIAFAAQDQQVRLKLSALEKLPRTFGFVVIGDNRTGDDVYRKIIGRVVDRNPSLIVNTGDQITQPGSRDQWQRFWEMSRPVTMPYFLTVGNHDASPGVPGSEDVYREEVDLPGNELYYAVPAGNALFIVLDSCISGEEKRITGKQFAWLEAILAGAKRKHLFVFVHHPLFPDPTRGRHAGSSLDAYPQERDRLHALFVQYHVTAVFQGHEHVYLRTTRDGIQYITAGGGGAPLYAKDTDGGFHHYVYMTVDGEAVSGEVVDLGGRVRDRFTIEDQEQSTNDGNR